jgi:hypothetical protein
MSVSASVSISISTSISISVSISGLTSVSVIMLDEQVYMTGECSLPHFEVLQSAPQVLHCESRIPLQAIVAKT